MGMQGAGMGMQIVGTELQGWASILAQQAMQHALGSELRKQQGFRENATGMQMLQLPRQGAEQANKEIGAGSQQRQADYKGLYNYSGATGTDKAAINTEGKSRADLAGYGDWQSNRSLDLSQLGSDVQRINSRAGGEAQLFPYRMNNAQHSQDAMKAIGQAISSLGGGASNIGDSLQSQPQPLTSAQQSSFAAGNGPVNASYATTGKPVGWSSPYSSSNGGSQYITSLY